MTGETLPSTIHTINSGTVNKIEMYPGKSTIHLHLSDGHVVILEWNVDTSRLIEGLMLRVR